MRRITSHSRAHRSSSAALRLCLVSLALAGGLAACAPQNTGATYSSATMGVPAAVTYGVVKGTRPVTVQSGRSGVGTAAGAVAGGVAGSFIGGDWRSNVLGGLAGNAIERGTGTGQAIEFIIQQDNGGDIAVVQTNEDNLQVGDRVFITHGPDQVRIGRAIGAPPPATGVSARPIGAYAPK